VVFLIHILSHYKWNIMTWVFPCNCYFIGKATVLVPTLRTFWDLFETAKNPQIISSMSSFHPLTSPKATFYKGQCQ
jgi:hypothetical protein